MAETEITTPVAAQQVAPPRQGEPCESCGAPLAADQRYCLNCGQRRGGPRVDYRHYMAAAAGGSPPSAGAAPATPAGPEEEPAKRERDYAPLAAVGGIAVLGLMLLVGVLIGKGNSSTTTSSPAPVIKLPSGESTKSSTDPGSEGKTQKKAKGSGSGGTGATKKGLTGSNANSNATVEASSGELEELQSESGASYEEQSKKLPNKIATPGKPPPIDKTTPPGGGEGGAEVIK